MTTTRVFKSTDTSAPTLTGQTGSVAAIILACLVGTSGVAYGSGGTAKTALGWTSPFTNTSTKIVVQNSAAAGATGCCVRILDDGSGAASFKEAFMTVYQTMSDINTGTNIIPSVAQLANGVAIRKSETADSTTRPWILVGDEKTFYFWCNSNPSTAAHVHTIGAGDINSYIASDTFRYFCCGQLTYNSASVSTGFSGVGNNTSISSSSQFFLGSDYNLSYASTPANFMLIAQQGSVPGKSGPFPGPMDGSSQYMTFPAWVVTYTASHQNIRGVLRGMYVSPCNLATLDGTDGTSYGYSGFSGATNLMLLSVYNASNATRGYLMFDVTNAWG